MQSCKEASGHHTSMSNQIIYNQVLSILFTSETIFSDNCDESKIQISHEIRQMSNELLLWVLTIITAVYGFGQARNYTENLSNVLINPLSASRAFISFYSSQCQAFLLWLTPDDVTFNVQLGTFGTLKGLLVFTC